LGIIGPIFRSPYDRDGKSTSFPRSNSIDWMNWKEIRSDKADLERSLEQANHERSLQKENLLFWLIREFPFFSEVEGELLAASSLEWIPVIESFRKDIYQSIRCN